jgi:propionyl-CoA carboxylase beta chain
VTKQNLGFSLACRVILPHETRERICRSLGMLRDQRIENPWRKHWNIPL